MTSNYNHQDWTPVILTKKKPKSAKDAKKRGYITTQQKKFGSSNKLYKNDMNSNSIDEEKTKLKKITVNLRLTIQKARTAVNLTQAQFAQRLNLPVSTR